MEINVIGAGLAGSEAALQLSKRGLKVNLFEMRPKKSTGAHKTDKFAEFVCSNSLGASDCSNASGLLKKEMELRHDGAWYHISPWGLSWDDENYYLVGYDSEAELIKHYRVDKMLHIRMSTEAREGKEHFKQLDMADYAKKSFGMFGGKEKTVKLLVDNRLAGVIIDRFGKDIMLIPADENHFTVNVDVHVSKQFLGWVFSLGEQVKILSPEDVVEEMRGEVKRLVEQYDSRVKI